ncbi:MAG: hypothetical protein GC154_00360 [bacterium]|nr:hypothetical protein [bacterium]
MSSKKPVYLHVFWHQHQPWYNGPDSNVAWMPWVRMHGVKDYYDMAWLCKRFEGWKQTINLVPSLLEQIRGYCEKGCTDSALELSRKPAADLTRDEKRIVLERFFDAHAQRMIDPIPRYNELQQKRGGAIEEAIDRFTTQDYLDLQVWFNLTWVDPIWKENPDEPLTSLVSKGRGFTEEDKQALLDEHIKILKRIIPIHQKMAEKGALELTTTPYFHPIMPLLCDSAIARVSNPHDPTPEPPFHSPEDALRHIENGLAYFQECFGFRPRGMWPSEGSVSDQACALMAKAGVTFFCTDEAVLFGSKPFNGHEWKREDLFKLHRLATPEGELDCVFRDHGLSDLIGFINQNQPAKQAAKDLIRHLKNIGEDWNADAPPLISIILDGENCWEYYPRDGHDFLQYFIEGVLKDSQVIPTTVPEYRDSYSTDPTLESIFPASWINRNFRIWIGHPEDNLAWSLLRDGRAALIEAESRLDEETRSAAWRALDICEGSDWFWWYGDENSSAHDFIFDQLFRGHLAHLYQLIGADAPEALRHPIKKTHRKLEGAGGRLLQTPDLDREDAYFEWAGAQFVPAAGGGAMHQANSLDGEIRYGRHENRFCFRIDFSFDAPPPGKARYLINVTRPEEKQIPLDSGHDAVSLVMRNRRLLGIVDMNAWGLDPEDEFGFYFIIERDGELDATIPAGGELRMQGAEHSDDGIAWFL